MFSFRDNKGTTIFHICKEIPDFFIATKSCTFVDMDIDLLAKMVGELILENDEVALPGVGTFVAELVGASFSDKGFTINPPYRKLSFRQREGDGDLLIDFYARTNSLEKATAADILTRYLAEMKEVLKAKKFIIFPGLGRLRATKENLFFFVPDEDLNIYPEGFGLEPVSLKSHEELEEVSELEETAAAVAAIQGAPSAPDRTNTAESVRLTLETAPDRTETAESVRSAADKTAVAPTIPPEEMADQVGHDAPATAETTATAPADAPAPAKAPAAETPATEAPAAEPAPPKPFPAWLKTLLIVLAVAAAALALLAILGRVAPNLVDRLLYTKEELEILYR